MTRFDLDNLDTPAIRALAERQPELEKAIAERRAREEETAHAMSIADIKQCLGKLDNGENPKTKAEWVKLYVDKAVAATPYAANLRTLERDAHMDRLLAKTLNKMMDDADDAREQVTKLSEVHIWRQMAVLESAIITQYQARHAAEIITGVVEYNANLQELAQIVVAKVVKMLISTIDGRGLTEPQEIKAAKAFYDTMKWNMPEFDLKSRDLG